MSRMQNRARRAQDRPWVEKLARAGIFSRAFVYLVLTYLTARLALSQPRTARDNSQGALEELAHQPGGTLVVVALGLGFVLYAGWRFLQAAAGDSSQDGDQEAAKRVGWAFIAVVYLFLCGQVVALLAGGSGGGRSAPGFAARLLGVPGGRVLLVLVGLGVVVGGLGLLGWAVAQRFEVYMPMKEMPAPTEVGARVVGTFGNGIRALVFAALGASLVVAGLAGSPHDAKDLDSGLRLMHHHAYGPAVLWSVAAGFLAFCAMSVLEALFREV